MLKNKFKIIIVLMLAIMLLIIPIANAENETNEELISQNQQTADDNLKKGDVYLTGDNVVIDYIIDGNLYVMADTVTINSQIGGDAFILSNDLTIGEQGYIFSNLFTASKNITINGIVCDLYSASNNLTINGYIYRDIRVTSDTINISGIVGRNAYANCTNLNLLSNSEESTESTETSESTETIGTSSNAVISGNLNYSSTEEASIPSGAVRGEINFEKEEIFTENTISTYLISLGTFVITIAAIWLICLWIAPKFIQNNTSLITTKKILPIIGLGILTPIVLSILSILLLVLGITSTIGLLVLVALFVLIAISTSIFVITVNSVICQKLKITKNVTIFGILIISSIVLWLIGLIPYIGSIISLLAVILGLGIITYSLPFKHKKD